MDTLYHDYHDDPHQYDTERYEYDQMIEQENAEIQASINRMNHHIHNIKTLLDEDAKRREALRKEGDAVFAKAFATLEAVRQELGEAS